jgi:two-component sensor histidine kinase
MADEQTSFRLAVLEQECEQLQTTLETAETEIQALARENRQLRAERSRFSSENARLRHLLLLAERTGHLEQALAERDELLRCKDRLLYELGHRVRDSMQVVMSLIRIQTGRSGEPLVRQALQTTGARIHAVAQVHDRLFTGDGSGRVRMDRYLAEICQQIVDAFGVQGRHQTLEVEAEPIELPADLAFPLGLIVTELVGNAMRHAFGESGTGTVWVQFERMPDGLLKLVIADDGKGITPSVEFSNTVGLGMHIVALMVQRLRAGLSVAHVHGSCFTLRFPENDVREAMAERDCVPPRSGSK